LESPNRAANAAADDGYPPADERLLDAALVATAEKPEMT